MIVSGGLAGVFQEDRGGKDIHHRPRGKADCEAWSSMLGVQTITSRWPFLKGNVPARKGQPLVLEVESLGIKIRSFDLLQVLRQLSNIERFLL